jgi:hypothetical protein
MDDELLINEQTPWMQFCPRPNAVRALVVAAASGVATLSSCSYAMTSTCTAYQTRITKLAQEIRPRVLVATRGSGNFGESGSAGFYTIDKLPSVLANPERRTNPQLERVDIDLGPDRLAFYIDNVLTHHEADYLAACAEAILEHNGHSRLAPGIQTPPGMRINQASHWYPSHEEAPTFLGSVFDRFRHLVPKSLDDMPLHDRLSEKVAQFKYDKGDEFKRHIDGLFPGQGANQEGNGVDEWIGVVSGMSMLFFLNDYETDGLVGGQTRLWSADGSKHFDVVPRKGRLLFFRRGSQDAVLHAGLPVTGDVPKYMALINLAYGERTGTGSLM